MKRAFYFWLGGLLSASVLLTQCRPGAPARSGRTGVVSEEKTPVAPAEGGKKVASGETPAGEAPDEKTLPVPPQKTGPVFRVTSRGSIGLRRLGALSQPVGSLAVHPKCTGVLAGAPHWELARFDAGGKLAWTTRNLYACPPKNRCREVVRAAFLPNENVAAVMDGDSLRMFNPKGRMQALRGGFLQNVLDFRVSPDGRLVGALYPHGLAIWRASGGLVRKPEIPGAGRFVFDFSQQEKFVRVATDRQVRRYPLDFSAEPEIRTWDEDIVDIGRDRVLTATRSVGPEGEAPLPSGMTPVRLVSTGAHVVLGRQGGKWLIVRLSAAGDGSVDVDAWEIAGISAAETMVVDVNEGCLAMASGADVYFDLLPPFGVPAQTAGKGAP